MKLKTFAALALLVLALYWPAKLIFELANPKAAQAAEAPASAVQAAVDAGLLADVSQKDSVDTGADRINNLNPNENTPENYIPPKFDPFNNIYKPETRYEETIPPLKQPNTKPEADFSMQPKRKGFAEKNMATIGTDFKFSAAASSDSETSSKNLQVRWDFDDGNSEGDGKPDTYFSRTKSATHRYDKAGTYMVKLEVLDRNGGVSSTIKPIKIVENTAPTAYQTAKIKQATLNTVFDFDTSKSADSQYLKETLEYRFDWDNDGIFDTVYKSKTLWKHKFVAPGLYHVIMEVKDPEGLTSTYYQNVEATENIPPSASFTVEKKESSRFGTSKEYFYFDATESSDTETARAQGATLSGAKLLYRWDFNYTGEDDIVFDTNFTSLPKYTGTYSVPGHKVVRLQVKDSDGAISEAFAELDAG